MPFPGMAADRKKTRRQQPRLQPNLHRVPAQAPLLLVTLPRLLQIFVVLRAPPRIMPGTVPETACTRAADTEATATTDIAAITVTGIGLIGR